MSDAAIGGVVIGAVVGGAVIIFLISIGLLQFLRMRSSTQVLATGTGAITDRPSLGSSFTYPGPENWYLR